MNGSFLLIFISVLFPVRPLPRETPLYFFFTGKANADENNFFPFCLVFLHAVFGFYLCKGFLFWQG
ncbi:MAG: hypothetical protein CSB28_01190 [Desulfobacterales bacterium]|nr:MAG: hypothetical protein CSB28_01190 [Desulfobacterales bacterium]